MHSTEVLRWCLKLTQPYHKRCCKMLVIWFYVKMTLIGLLYIVIHFYPRPVLSFGYCRCLRLCVCVCVSVCLCGNHLLVRAITRDTFELGSPNLNQRCKRPWFRSLLFCGLIDLDLQGQIELESPNLPRFELARTITHRPFKLGSPNLDQRCKILWLRSLLFCGAIDLDLQGQTWLKKSNFQVSPYWKYITIT